MSVVILIVMFVHADGVHSITAKFDTLAACEQAASQWRKPDLPMQRVREVFAKCHAGATK